MTEKELVLKFKEAKAKRDKLKGELKTAQAEYDKTEASIIEFLENNSAVATAKYEGVGYIQLQKPKLYANCREDNLESLFAFLKKEEREDLIKTTVPAQSLSSFVKERIEEGEEIPECIGYYLKPTIRLYV